MLRNINLSEPCLATRLLQLSTMGMQDMRPKAEKEMALLARQGPQARAESLWPVWHKACLAMERLTAGSTFDPATTGLPYGPTLVLWSWFPTKVGATTSSKAGRLVFMDCTARHWWYLEEGCGDGSHVCEHKMSLTHRHADEVFCMATYLGYRPLFVRFFCMGREAVLPKDFLEPAATAARPGRVDCTERRYGEVAPGQYRAVLGRDDLLVVDSLITSDSLTTEVITDCRRKAVGGTSASASASASSGGSVEEDPAADAAAAKALFDAVCAGSEPGSGVRVGVPSPQCRLLDMCDEDDKAKGRVGPVEPLPKTCASCFKVGKHQACSGCFLVFYCSKNCQVAHWRSDHKAVCRAPKGPQGSV